MTGGVNVMRKQTFILIPLLSILAVFLNVFVSSVVSNNYVACVYIDPNEQIINSPNENFTLNVKIRDVLDLYGYEFKLFYNSTILNATAVKEGSFLNQNGETFFYICEFNDHYNSTHGIIWIDCCLTGDVLGEKGNGTLATISFRSFATGSSNICLSDIKLVDSKGEPIPYESVNGSLIVAPELTLQISIMAIMFTTLLIVFLKLHKENKVYRKRNKLKNNRGFSNE